MSASRTEHAAPATAVVATSISVAYPSVAGPTPPDVVLARVDAAGYQGVQLRSVRELDATLDRGALRELGAIAADLGLRLEAGIGCAGPDGDTDAVVAELGAQIEAGAEAGITEFFVYTRVTRPERPAQLDVIAERLRALAPVAAGDGAYVNLKTHEDLSSVDVLTTVERVDHPSLGVGLDVANLVVRGEDPVTAAARLAPHLRQTHLEDIALFFVADGLRRRLRPCGAGVLDWTALLGVLDTAPAAPRLTLEQHRGLFDVPLFDPHWFDHEPQVGARDVAALVHLARQTEERVARGQIPPLAELPGPADEASAWAELQTSADHLRRVAAA